MNDLFHETPGQAAPDVTKVEMDINENHGALIILLPDGTRRRITLDEKRTLIVGRAKKSDVHLAGRRISRRHARIEFDGWRFSVTDLDSTHGTLLDDARLPPQVPHDWAPDATLHIGPYQFNVVAPTVPQDAAVTLEPQDLIVEAGQSARARLHILNQGKVVSHLKMSVVGVPDDWISPLPVAQLLPDDREQVDLVIRPPRDPTSRAMTYPLTVQVDGSPHPVAEGSLTVVAYYDFDLDLHSKIQSGRGQGSFEVQINNQGNTDLAVQLDATDPEAACRYTLDPPQAVIPPGQEHSVKLVVQTTKPQPRENAKIYFFTITAQVEGRPELTRQIQGQWTQTPRPGCVISRLLRGCIETLLGLLIIAISLFMVLITQLL